MISTTADKRWKMVDYSLFLPPITAATYNKGTETNQLSKSEFRQIVANTFRDSVVQVMKDTLAYQVTIPVDLYEGVQRYDIIAPEGYMVEDVINVWGVRDYNYTTKELVINCCPDVDSIAHVRVALVPFRSVCEFDEEFVNRYYELILDLMLSKLLAMPERSWFSLEQAQLTLNKYENQVIQEQRKELLSDMMGTQAEDSTDYTRFLPLIAASIYSQAEEKLSLVEFKQMVSLSYRNSVMKVMRDTLMYRVSLPIDLYEAVQTYNIVPPKGFVVEDVITFYDGQIKVPSVNYNNEQITIANCPKCDTSQAFYVEVALVPSQNNDTTQFDEWFINRYKQLIQEAILEEMYGMSKRSWGDASLMDYHRRNYEKQLSNARSQSIITDAMNKDRGSALFLPVLTSALFNDDENQLSQSEFKQIVELVYVDAVTQVMQDTKLYKVQLPIDLYQDVKRYDIIPPNGYVVVDVDGLLEYKSKVPKHTHTLDSIELMCCPTKDIPEAFYVEVALAPKRNNDSHSFDDEFVDRYYQLIMTLMKSELLGMTERYWYDPGQSAMYKNRYWGDVNTVKREAITAGSKIKINKRRLTDV